MNGLFWGFLQAQRCSKVPHGTMSCLFSGELGQDSLSSYFQLIFGPEDLMLHLGQSIFIAGAGRVIVPAGTGCSDAQLGSAGELGALMCQVTTQPTCQAGAGSQLLTGRHIPSCSGSCGLARNVKETTQSPLHGVRGCARAGLEHSQQIRGVVWMFYLLYRKIWGRWQCLGGRSTAPSPSRPLHSCLRHKIRQAAFCTEKIL